MFETILYLRLTASHQSMVK